jgi:hypothetical protein
MLGAVLLLLFVRRQSLFLLCVGHRLRWSLLSLISRLVLFRATHQLIRTTMTAKLLFVLPHAPSQICRATMTTNSPLALLHASHRLTVTLSKLWCHIGSPLVALLMVAMVNMLLPSKVRVRNIRSSLLKWLFVVLTGRMALVSGTTTWVVTAISRRI